MIHVRKIRVSQVALRTKQKLNHHERMSAKTIESATQEQTVKRLLRHRGSREYFKDGQWTNNPDEASNFSDVVEAAETCARYELSDVELALRLDSRSCDVFCTSIR